jgi:hypothetical protein
LVITLVVFPSAFGNGRGIRDDQIPYGPEGTIGRGTDSDRGPSSDGIRIDGSTNDFRPSGYYRSSKLDNIYLFIHYKGPTTYSASAAARPYLTNQYHEPGDGYRYPLYYNPATRTYFYYPAGR